MITISLFEAEKIMVYGKGKSFPNGRTIQVSEIL